MIDIIARHNSDTEKWEVHTRGLKDLAEVRIWMEEISEGPRFPYGTEPVLRRKVLYQGPLIGFLKRIEEHDKINRRLEIIK